MTNSGEDQLAYRLKASDGVYGDGGRRLRNDSSYLSFAPYLREFSRVVLRCDCAWLREPFGNVNAGVQQDVAPWIEGARPHDKFGFVTEF